VLKGTAFMAKKSQSSASASGGQSSRGEAKVHKVMKEYKEGELNSSSGDKVTSRKQAVAIALSEARAGGAKIPPNPNKTT
jgi:hypothetical protein